MADEERKECLEVLNWIKGVDDGVSRICEHPKVDTKWYIVSSKWLNKWKRLKKLEDFTTSEDENEMDIDLGMIDSEDIIDNNPAIKIKNNYILKQGLSIGRDYEILPKKAWKYLTSHYNFKHKITRKSIAVDNNNDTQIEISLFPLNVIFVIEEKLESAEPIIFHVSRSDGVVEVIDSLKSFHLTQKQYDYNSRLWKLNRDVKIEDLEKLMQESLSNSIIFPGVLLDNKHQSIMNFEIAFDDILVLESIKENYTSDYFFKEKDKEICEYCRKYTYGGQRCQCKKYYYCNDMCEERDRSFHYCRKNNKIYSLTQNSCLGKVGLQNMGNTCYMNSGLQCLSNTSSLTNYILNDQYLADINVENHLGSKGALITEFAALIKEMWYGSSRCVSPWGLKRAFSEFAKQFVGFHQQDSQEMLSFLIDGIHEDLNRVKVKKMTEDPDRTGLTENEIAAKFWENHLARNDSIIVDLMHGQYRSEVECPKCGKVSITFDPFLMLTLPIPEKTVKNIEFIYVDTDQAIKGKVSVMKGSNAATVKNKVCELLGLDPDNILIADTNMGSLKSIITGSAKVTKRNPLMLYNHVKNALNENDSQIIFCDFRKKSYGYSGTIVGQPHLLKIPKDITLEGLYLHVFEYVLKLKKENPEDLEALFREKFGNFFSKTGADNLFTLKIHNPYQYPCVICDRISCPGCLIPFEAKKLSKFSSKCQEPNLRMTITFGEQYYDTSFLSNLKTHDNYFYRNNDNKLNESVEISECFNLFSRKEKLDELNTSYCSSCKEHVEGIKKMDIFRLPKILIIHFKRFKQKGYFSSKNNKLVEFPIEGLDMQPFCLNGGGIYDLYAVSNHYGSLEGGHYTAYAKSNDGVWRDFDDSSVSVISNVKETVVATSAYVLFYMKRE